MLREATIELFGMRCHPLVYVDECAKKQLSGVKDGEGVISHH